jgi:hypothetical protein
LTSVFFSQRFGSNFTLLAGKMNMFDFYAAGHKFSGGRGIEGFWNVAFVGPPSGFVPIGDPTLFIRGDEAEEAWRIIEPVMSGWAAGDVPMQTYPAGGAPPGTAR